MSKPKELINEGVVFGKWKIIQEEPSKNKQRYFLCECLSCGKRKTTALRHIKYGKSTQCLSCAASERLTTHGKSTTHLYQAWNNMKKRCKKNFRYKDIEVCKEWENFLVFEEWAVCNGYQDNLTLDRIDGTKNYSPTNCRWVTQQVQSENQRHLKSTNTSGYKGVSFIKRKNKFIAQISVNNKHINIGSTFTTAEEAAIAYDTFVLENNLINRSLNILQRT